MPCDTASYAVLVQPDLLARIVAFQTGMHKALHAFAARIRAANASCDGEWSGMTRHDRLASLARTAVRFGDDLRPLQLAARAMWYDAAGDDDAAACDLGVLEVLRRWFLADLTDIGKWDLQKLPPPIHSAAMVRWFHGNILNFRFRLSWLQRAVADDNLAVVKCLLEEVGLPCSDSVFYRAYATWCGNYGVLLYLLDNRTEDHGAQVERRAVAQSDVALLQLLYDSRGLRHLDGMDITSTVQRNDLDMLRFLHLHVTTKRPLDAIVSAAMSGNLDIVQFLHETSDMSERWPPSVMDSAAQGGHWHLVRFLHEHRNADGCTTRTMDFAAANGHIHMVRLLHEQRTEGCTTHAMDRAAANGHLDVVEYLHANRSEGCTTSALDMAATRGHHDVVRFLVVHRSERMTAGGVTETIQKKRVAVITTLFTHAPHLFRGATVMRDLLCAGAFDVWHAIRKTQTRDADKDDGVVTVMFMAGVQEELPTIQYIVDVLHREDLVHLAMDGAATRSAAWMLKVHDSYPGCCRLSAVQQAIERNYCPLDDTMFNFLISVCTDGTRADAVAHATLTGKLNLAQRLESPSSSRIPDRDLEIAKEAATLFPLDQDFDASNAVCRAIAHGQLHTLQCILRVSRHPIFAHRSTDGDYSFQRAQSAAIRYNKPAILQWLLKVKPAEPTLLDEALSYGRIDIAEWLVDNCPAACIEFQDQPSTLPATRTVRRTGVSSTTLAHIEGSAKLKSFNCNFRGGSRRFGAATASL